MLLTSKKRLWLVLSVLAVALVLVASCAPKKVEEKKPPVAEKPTKGGVFTYYIDEPAFIDPYNAQETEGVQIVANTFDGLVDFDPVTSEIKPAVAEKWKPNDDATVWTFTLRKGTKFHNGREVTAADFKYAWERIANPKTDPPSDISYHLSPIQGFDEMQEGKATELSGVKAPDKYTLEVTLKYPFADFEFVVGHPALAPVPKEEVEKDPKAFMEKPVGNGPFMMAEPWKHDEFVRVVRFDDYYGKKALLDEVVFKIFKDEETAFLEFQAGNVDFAEVPSGQIEATAKKFGKGKYEATPGKDLLLGEETATYYLNCNNENPILKNPDVRRAISLAINREAIAKTVYEGTRKPATGLVPPGVVGFRKNAGKYVKYDPEEAKKLLEKAGYPGGQGLPTLKLSFNSGAGHETVMQTVQANLKDIGINVELQGMEWAQFVDFRQNGKHELARDGWVFDYPIIDNMLFPLFHSKNIGKDNTSRYSNPEVDKAILDARAETDDEKRVELYQKAERLILEDAGAVPIVFYAHRNVAQEWVRGLVFSPLYLAHMENVWLAKKK